MAKHRMTILGAVHEDAMALIEARDDIDLTIVHEAMAPRDEIMDAIRGAEGINVRTARLEEDMLAEVPDLRIVSRHGVGTDSVAVAHMTSRGLPVAIAVGGNDRSVAEHTLGMMLHLARNMPGMDRTVRENDWTVRPTLGNFDLEDRTVLVVGYGRIGSRVAELAQAFGMRVIARDPYVNDFAPGIEVASTLEGGLAEADIVTVHVPKNAETTGIINRDTLDEMRPGTILINCARGGICDEAAVAEALHSGHLRSYGCDVFSSEPDTTGNPILDAPNTLLSPHYAASTPQGMRRMGMISVQNVLDCFDGKLRPEMVFNRAELRW